MYCDEMKKTEIKNLKQIILNKINFGVSKRVPVATEL